MGYTHKIKRSALDVTSDRARQLFPPRSRLYAKLKLSKAWEDGAKKMHIGNARRRLNTTLFVNRANVVSFIYMPVA